MICDDDPAMKPFGPNPIKMLIHDVTGRLVRNFSHKGRYGCSQRPPHRNGVIARPKSLRDWGRLWSTPVDSGRLQTTRNRQRFKIVRRYPDVAQDVADSAHAHSNHSPATACNSNWLQQLLESKCERLEPVGGKVSRPLCRRVFDMPHLKDSDLPVRLATMLRRENDLCTL